MSVFGMVSAVAGFVKVRYLIDKAIIDNMIFRCHYRITSALLFVSCIIVTANNLIGKVNINSWKKQTFDREFLSRWSNKLHKRWRCADSCDKHILLDNVHVYVTRAARESYWHASCRLRIGQWVRQRPNLPQLLSVGAFHPLLSSEFVVCGMKFWSVQFDDILGSDVLHSPLDLEKLGRRKDANDFWRLARSPHDANYGETVSSRPTRALPRRQPHHAQQLRIRILFLRILERRQCGTFRFMAPENK